MADLHGARVGLLEGRMGGELAGLVLRHGGMPVLAPAVREVTLAADAPVTELLQALRRGEVQTVVFLTGAGAAALFREADRLGRLSELVEALQGTTNVCRGQKPWRPLRQLDVPVSVTVPEPYTTADVLRTLCALRPARSGVGLLHYGERNGSLAETLRGWGASVLELCLYEWQLPEDTAPLERLIEAVAAGELEVVAFTSQVQVRHLLQIAERTGGRRALVAALNARTVVAAVGPTCAAALQAQGVAPRVVPAHPKMGPMVVAIADHIQGRVGSASGLRPAPPEAPRPAAHRAPSPIDGGPYV